MRSRSLQEIVEMITTLRDLKKDLYKSIDFPNALVGAIFEFDKIIGLEEFKVVVSRMIKLVIVEKSKKRYQYGENNIVLYGNPGCGKTTVAIIMAKILNSIGVHPEEYKNKENEKKESTLQLNNPFQLLLGQVNKDKIKSLQLLSQTLKKRNVLYQNYIRDISDASTRQMDVLNESIQYIDRYISQKNEKHFLIESKKLLLEGEKQSKYILGLINNFEENLKKIELPIEKINNSDEKEIKIINVEYWGDVKIEKEFKNKYRHVSPADFVAGFVGQTPIKTKELLEDIKGGVLFIDEAYDLAVPSKDNTRGADYGFQALTEITNFMTKKEGAVVFIMAGYQEDLEKNIFGLQKGLGRRFRFKIHIGNYDSEELADIFLGMIENSRLKIKSDIDIYHFFKKNEEYFTEFGGDCRILASICRELVAEEEINRVLALINVKEDSNHEEIFITLEMLKLSLEIKEKNKTIIQKKEKNNDYDTMYT